MYLGKSNSRVSLAETILEVVLVIHFSLLSLNLMVGFNHILPFAGTLFLLLGMLRSP